MESDNKIKNKEINVSFYRKILWKGNLKKMENSEKNS
jgi:hypothetical protein